MNSKVSLLISFSQLYFLVSFSFNSFSLFNSGDFRILEVMLIPLIRVLSTRVITFITLCIDSLRWEIRTCHTLLLSPFSFPLHFWYLSKLVFYCYLCNFKIIKPFLYFFPLFLSPPPWLWSKSYFLLAIHYIFRVANNNMPSSITIFYTWSIVELKFKINSTYIIVVI